MMVWNTATWQVCYVGDQKFRKSAPTWICLWSGKNAPRLWFLEVGKRLLAADFRPHALDRMCFLHYDKDGCLDCIALVHVDDFLVLVTYADQVDLTALTRFFKWGRTSFETDVVTFQGKQFRTVIKKIAFLSSG